VSLCRMVCLMQTVWTFLRSAILVLGSGLLTVCSIAGAGVPQHVQSPLATVEDTGRTKRRFTQEDAIAMVRIAGHGASSEYAGTLTKDFAYFSPDGKKFAIILKRGKLESNTNEYTLLLFDVAELSPTPKPRILVSMSSSSNREAIKDLAWLSDSDSLLFLGENPGETTQLYMLRTSEGTVQKLTNRSTNLIAFAADNRGERIVYAVEKPASPVLTAKTQREGVVVSNQTLADLLGGSVLDNQRDLVALDLSTGKERPFLFEKDLNGQLWGDFPIFFISPDGRYLVLKTNLSDIPATWRAYREPSLLRVLNRQLPHGALTWMFRYGVIDLESGRTRVLLDSPVSSHGSEVAWSPDGLSVVLTGVFLPVDDSRDDAELLSNPSVVEVELSDLDHRRIGTGDLRFLSWAADENILEFESRQATPDETPNGRQYFRKLGGQWQQERRGERKTKQEVPLRIVSEQDLNTPPTITAFDAKSGASVTLVELNPELRGIALGRVEEIKFLGAGSAEVHAGLYYPPDFKSGNKYPLVVQTHGFDPKSFWIDGSFTTAFAAQGLASHGMLVLQIPDRHDWSYETPDEAPRMMETLENAVDYVDHLGILDRNRMAIVGFSRTGLYAYYMLTHSKVHFRAAVMAESSDGGYSQYLQFLDSYPFTASDSESINGGVPFGSGLLYWLRHSPEFLIDTVDTPVMIQAASHESLSMQIAEFKGLRRLGKAVELIYLPNGTHILEKPWDRLASQQGTVDWCAFWLKSEEDPSLSKADKYSRWRAMRDVQNMSNPKSR
jgi:dipeptidyl aminopeptidase/acylaminoacyl peptidase